MEIIEQIGETIKALKEERLEAVRAHDWAAFDALTRLIGSTRRHKESWEAKLHVERGA